jgi:hypothetical protein
LSEILPVEKGRSALGRRDNTTLIFIENRQIWWHEPWKVSELSLSVWNFKLMVKEILSVLYGSTGKSIGIYEHLLLISELSNLA